MANIAVSLTSLTVGITTPTPIDTLMDTVIEPVLVQTYTVAPVVPTTQSSSPTNTGSTYWVTG